MGRPKGRFADLPRHMTGRDAAGGGVLYYHQAHGKKTALGKDLAAALRQYALLEAGRISSAFLSVSDAYEAYVEGLKRQKMMAPTTVEHYGIALTQLRKAFSKGALEQIKPQHVKQYIRRRTKKASAIFEKKVLSAMWNWAREEGITDAPNPCHGIKFSHAERKALGKFGKRDRYVTHAEFAEVHLRADPILQDALDLAYLTGQRPSDLLKMTRQDIKEGVLMVVQDKTGTKVPIKIEGKLKRVLERALGRERRIQSMYVIADKNGQRWTYDQLHDRFMKALGDGNWQFRDIRAKTATDLPDIRSAQRLLGHANETTTTIYRRAQGDAISPLEPDSEPF